MLGNFSFAVQFKRDQTGIHFLVNRYTTNDSEILHSLIYHQKGNIKMLKQSTKQIHLK